MIIEIRANNCYSFEEPVALSLQADMRNKKFASNVHTEKQFHVLKTVGIYGQNNAGKTCLIKCVRNIKQAFLDKRMNLSSNMFSGNAVCGLGITFLHWGRKFSYDFQYDTSEEIFVFEKFAEILKDQYGNEKEIVWLLINDDGNEYKCIDNEAEQMIPMIVKKSMFCHVIDTGKFKYIE